MPFLMYGAYGYTGRLLARAAVGRGMEPLLAGRDEIRLRALAEDLALPYRAFSLSDDVALDDVLNDVPLVLHVAGPFVRTAMPMVEGCLRTGTDYLDITGEIGVFEMLAALDEQAEERGSMLLPGVGFDVVPTDCLAVHLHERLPAAQQLEVAVYARGSFSRGTITSAIEHLGQGGFIRRDGALQQVPLAWRRRIVDFGDGPVDVIGLPWGDVATAYRSTGIPNISTYVRLPGPIPSLIAVGSRLEPVLAKPSLKRLLRACVQRCPEGPSAEARRHGASRVWGEAIGEAGERVVARLRGPEAYDFTVQSALAAVRRVLGGERAAGFQTPATAFGADFVFEVDGVTREDVV